MGTAGTCPPSSQQRLDDAETRLSFVLVLGMQDSADSRLIAGFSASRVHFLVIALCLKWRNIKSGSVFEVSADGETENADLVAGLNSPRTFQI